jgi:hypothetical protein
MILCYQQFVPGISGMLPESIFKVVKENYLEAGSSKLLFNVVHIPEGYNLHSISKFVRKPTGGWPLTRTKWILKITLRCITERQISRISGRSD